METLLNAPRNLCTHLQKGDLKKGGGHLLRDVMNGYQDIAHLTGHVEYLECGQEDKDDNNEGDDNNDKESDNTDNKDSDMSDGTSHLSKDSDASSSGSEGESKEDLTSSKGSEQNGGSNSDCIDRNDTDEQKNQTEDELDNDNKDSPCKEIDNGPLVGEDCEHQKSDQSGKYGCKDIDTYIKELK